MLWCWEEPSLHGGRPHHLTQDHTTYPVLAHCCPSPVRPWSPTSMAFPAVFLFHPPHSFWDSLVLALSKTLTPESPPSSLYGCTAKYPFKNGGAGEMALQAKGAHGVNTRPEFRSPEPHTKQENGWTLCSQCCYGKTGGGDRRPLEGRSAVGSAVPDKTEEEGQQQGCPLDSTCVPRHSHTWNTHTET